MITLFYLMILVLFLASIKEEKLIGKKIFIKKYIKKFIRIYPTLYTKIYFKYYNKNVMTYIMVKKTQFRYPTEKYLNVIKQGYKDCNLDKSYLTKALKNIK